MSATKKKVLSSVDRELKMIRDHQIKVKAERKKKKAYYNMSRDVPHVGEKWSPKKKLTKTVPFNLNYAARVDSRNRKAKALAKADAQAMEMRVKKVGGGAALSSRSDKLALPRTKFYVKAPESTY